MKNKPAGRGLRASKMVWLTPDEAKTLKAAKDVLKCPFVSINGKFLRDLVKTIERLAKSPPKRS